MTGLVVGATLGALASPRLSEPGASVDFVATATDSEHAGAHGGEVSVDTSSGPHPAVTVALELEVAASVTPGPVPTPTATTLATATATTEPAVPSTSTPPPDEPGPDRSSTTVEPTTTTVTAPPTPTTTVAPRPTLCSQLAPTRESKLDVPAEVRRALDLTGTARYDVVITLESPQSSSPGQEQQLRVASLANFAEVGPERFQVLDAAHVVARLDSAQLCRLVFLRPVVQVQVRPAAG